MEAVINSGGTVLWNGKIIYTIEDLPTQDEIDALLEPPREGKSAFEIAVDNGFVGTEEEWLDTLVGAQGPQGVDGDDGAPGAEGDSAYEVAVANGFVGTEAEWLESLQGEPGAGGTGDVNGPASSTDSGIVLFDGLTGKLIKDSGVLLSSLATDAELTSGLATKQDSLGFTPVPNTRTVNGHALSADVTVTKSDVGLGNVTNDAQLKAADLDTDSTMAADSDSKIPSQKAVKTALATKQASLGFTAANDADVVHDTGNESIAGVKTFTDDPIVPDEAYDATNWNGSMEVPTKNAIRDKIETLAGPQADGSVTGDVYNTTLSTAAAATNDVVTGLTKGAYKGIRVWVFRTTAGAGTLTAQLWEEFPDGTLPAVNKATTPSVTTANTWSWFVLYPAITGSTSGAAGTSPNSYSADLPPTFRIRVNTNGGGGSAGLVKVYYQLLG